MLTDATEILGTTWEEFKVSSAQPMSPLFKTTTGYTELSESDKWLIDGLIEA